MTSCVCVCVRARASMDAARSGLNMLLMFLFLLIILIPDAEAFSKTGADVSRDGEKSVESQLQVGPQKKNYQLSDPSIGGYSLNQCPPCNPTTVCPRSGGESRARNVGRLQWMFICVLLIFFLAPDITAKLQEFAISIARDTLKHSAMGGEISMDAAAGKGGAHMNILSSDG